MLNRFITSAIFSLFFINISHAENTSFFLTDIDSAFAHYRESVSYLRTGNIDLGAIELDEMALKWAELEKKYADSPPDMFAGNKNFKATLTSMGAAISDALKLIDAGDPKAARARLLPLRETVSKLRSSSNIYTLADCILDASQAMDNLFVYKGKPPEADDWTKRADVVSKAAIYADTVRRCDRMASAKTRVHPEFRRLFDGTMESAVRIAEAIGANNGGLLFRLLIEMRSFDRLIFYRFG